MIPAGDMAGGRVLFSDTTGYMSKIRVQFCGKVAPGGVYPAQFPREGRVGNLARRGEITEPDQPKRPRSIRGDCAPCPTKALAYPSHALWEEALAAPPNPGPHDNKESCGKVQGDTGKGRRHGICALPWGLARVHNGSPPVEREFIQEPRIA